MLAAEFTATPNNMLASKYRIDNLSFLSGTRSKVADFSDDSPRQKNAPPSADGAGEVVRKRDFDASILQLAICDNSGNRNSVIALTPAAAASRYRDLVTL